MNEQIPFSQPSPYQHTVGSPVSCEGVGLHTGKRTRLVLRPAETDTGLVFNRTDVSDKNTCLTLHPQAVYETRRGTCLANADGVSLATVEHVLAALSACGVDNTCIDVDGPEIPAMDGSAQAFTDMVVKAGLVQQKARRKYIEVLQPLECKAGDAYVRLEPSEILHIDASIHYPDTLIGDQDFQLDVTSTSFIKQIAPARTFVLAHEVQALQEEGLALGGSLYNCIVVDGMHIQNQEALRFENEFIRHKVLDILGDLALAGAPILGRFTSHYAGHALNNALLRLLISDHSAWRWKTFS